MNCRKSQKLHFIRGVVSRNKRGHDCNTQNAESHSSSVTRSVGSIICYQPRNGHQKVLSRGANDAMEVVRDEDDVCDEDVPRFDYLVHSVAKEQGRVLVDFSTTMMEQREKKNDTINLVVVPEETGPLLLDTKSTVEDTLKNTNSLIMHRRCC